MRSGVGLVRLDLSVGGRLDGSLVRPALIRASLENGLRAGAHCMAFFIISIGVLWELPF